MPGKSRRKRGKHLPQRRKENRISRSAMPVQQPIASVREQPVAQPSVPPPPPAVPKVTKTIARYSHIAAELRTIGILTALMLIILIVLALVLPRYGL